jgi:hypothetical protein
MESFKEQYQKQTDKSPYVYNKRGELIGNFSYTDGYVLWLESKLSDAKSLTNDYNSKKSINLMWHIPTNQVGQFLKETNPTGKPTTIVIKLFDGRTYFAPKSEFKSFSLDTDF